MRTNPKAKSDVRTHEGAPAQKVRPIEQLRRTVLACLLWEDSFYESGVSVADRIKDLVGICKIEDVSQLAIDARSQMHLRHVPLLLIVEMLNRGVHSTYDKIRVRRALETVIQRADEPAEFLALWWKDGRRPIPAIAKKALRRALTKFDAYQLAKWRGQRNAVKLRDVLRLVHPKPCDEAQARAFKGVIDGSIPTPDTWEVELSASTDKKASWTRLLVERRLGSLALLRNLRNMINAGVDNTQIRAALTQAKPSRLFPFRFITAAQVAPKLEAELDLMFQRCLTTHERLPGKTVLIVDVSGSMYGAPVSVKSKMDRAHAACALAALVRGVAESIAIYATAGNDMMRVHDTREVPPRQGLALIDTIHGMCSPLGGGGIFLRQVMDYVYHRERDADRVIVITDEQDCGVAAADHPSKANAFGARNYILNVGTYSRGIAYDKWIHIHGFSESAVDFIREREKLVPAQTTS